MTFAYQPANLPDDPKEMVRALRDEFFAIKRGLEAVDPVHAPTLLNSWVNLGSGYTNAGYWKDPFGVVHLTGRVQSGAVPSVIFILPAGYRPAADHVFATQSAGAFGALTVDSAGNVTAATGSSTNFSLSGLIFRAA